MKKIVERIMGASILLIGATFMMSFVSCKKPVAETEVAKDFVISSIKVWEVEAKGQESVTVKGSTEKKLFEVKISNCDDYTMNYELDKTKQDPVVARAGKASIINDDAKKIFAIEKDKEIEVFITLTASGFNKKEILLTVKREDEDVSGVQVMLTRTEDNSNPFAVSDGGKYQTVAGQATLAVVSKEAVMKSVKVAGVPITPTDAGLRAEKSDLAPANNIEVIVDFEEYKPYKLTFSLNKVASPQDINIVATSAIVYSGDKYAKKHELNFNADRVAEIKLNDIEYSCVKLEMNMDVELDATTTGLEVCKDERSSTYSTKYNDNDLKGIFSGRLKAELDKDGELVEEYKTPVVGNALTEYLIVGSGTVEYQFKFAANNRKETKYTVKITNAKNKKVPTDGKGRFMYSTADSLRLFVGDCWTWENFTKLPAKSKTGKTNMEYMGDDAAILFFRIDTDGKDLMYFYHNVFDDKASKKHEFIRQVGDQKAEDTGKGKKFYYSQVNAVIQPEEKYVDGFVAYKDFLPSALHPTQTNNKWKKILEKGFMLQVRNGVAYQTQDGRRISTLDLFFEAFPYRVQSKIYEKGDTLAMGIKQKFEDFIDGKPGEMPAPFLMGGNGTIKNKQGQVIPIDRFLMTATFGGKMEDSIQSISYTIKKNKPGSTTEFENVTNWENVNLTPSKWQGMLVLGATDDSLDGNNVKEETLYLFEKGADKNENIYMVDVTVTTTKGTAEKFNYKINYKGEESVKNMGMNDGFDGDSDLFGVPTYYASEDAVVSEILQKAMYERQAKEIFFK